MPSSFHSAAPAHAARASTRRLAWCATVVVTVLFAVGCGEAFEHLGAPDDAAIRRDTPSNEVSARDATARSDGATTEPLDATADRQGRDVLEEDGKRGTDAVNDASSLPDGSLDAARMDGGSNDATPGRTDGSGTADAPSTRDVTQDTHDSSRAEDGSRAEDAPFDTPPDDVASGADVSADVPISDGPSDGLVDAQPDHDFVCGFAPPAPGGSCPAVCNEGCAGGICKIACREDQQCKEATLECPAGFTCQINCVGKQGCESASVICPDTFACSLLCGGEQSCKSLTLGCRSGTCNIECIGKEACEAVVNCGPQTCAAACQEPGAKGRPTMNCGESCDCRPCSP